MEEIYAAYLSTIQVTDVGDEMCWRQFWDVGDGFSRFCHEHPLSFKITVGHQDPKDATNIEILSLTSKNCHHDKVTNMYVSEFSISLKFSEIHLKLVAWAVVFSEF